MFEHDTLLFIAVCVAVAVLGIVLETQRRRKYPVATNALEHLLISSVGTAGVTTEMQELLSAVSLLALEPFDATEPAVEPMTVSFSFPAGLSSPDPACQVGEGGAVQFGPYVVCWSSLSWVNRGPRNSILDMMSTRIGRLREFPAREVFQSALAKQTDVFLNPFVGVSHRFTQAEMTAIVEKK